MTDLENLAVQIASVHKLDPALVLAICSVESGWNTWAVRYEPAFYQTYILPLQKIVPIGTCSLQTERTMRATSFGLMQMMGQNARNLGFADPFLSELCKPDVGITYGCLMLVGLMGRWDNKLMSVISAYNAGTPTVRNTIYVNKVQAEMQRYGNLLPAPRN